jgi:hypothetical protein
MYFSSPAYPLNVELSSPQPTRSADRSICDSSNYMVLHKTIWSVQIKVDKYLELHCPTQKPLMHLAIQITI